MDVVHEVIPFCSGILANRIRAFHCFSVNEEPVFKISSIYCTTNKTNAYIVSHFARTDTEIAIDDNIRTINLRPNKIYYPFKKNLDYQLTE